MRERCSRCSESSIWRVGGGQRIDAFFDVFFGVEKRGIFERAFAILCDFRSPEGVDWVPKWFQTASQKGGISVALMGEGPERVPGCHLGVF